MIHYMSEMWVHMEFIESNQLKTALNYSKQGVA